MSTPDVTTVDPAAYPKFNAVADPRVSPPRVTGVHFWVRLTDTDSSLSCLWCGQLRGEDTLREACPGKPRLDILNAPWVTETAEPVTLPPVDDSEIHVTYEHANDILSPF